jgi:hypothetical protein
MARPRIEARRYHLRLSVSDGLLLAAAAEASAISIPAWVRQQASRVVEGVPRAPAGFQTSPLRRPSGKLRRRIYCCLRDEEFEAIHEYARACRLTLSALTRQLLLGHKPIVRQPPARAAIVAVNRACTSLNQLVQLASSGVALAPELLHAVHGLLQEIHALRDALLQADGAASHSGPAD